MTIRENYEFECAQNIMQDKTHMSEREREIAHNNTITNICYSDM